MRPRTVRARPARRVREDSKPHVVSVKKWARDNTSGMEMDYDKFIFAGSGRPGAAGLEEVFGYDELTVDQAIDKLREMGFDQVDLEEVTSVADEEERLDALIDWADKYGKSDNTYNWSWWGPTLHFHGVQAPGEDDSYDPEMYFVRGHRGGDVRGNYGRYYIFYVESSAENAPWYSWSLSADLTLDDGSVVSVNSDDTENTEWYVSSDPSGTFKEGDTIRSRTLEDAFEWDEQLF